MEKLNLFNINRKNWFKKKRAIPIGVIFLIIATSILASFLIVACSGSDGSDSPTYTPTETPNYTSTPTPIPTVTPTPTPYTEWGPEQVALENGGDWINIDANDNSELCISYLKSEGGRTYAAFITRDQAGNWSSPKEAPGSNNNILYQKSFVRSAIDNSGDIHLVWADLGRESAFYNMWQAQSSNWKYTDRALDVIWSTNIIHPDIVTSETETKRYVVSQIEWGAGFNWDYGSDFQSTFDIPIWNEGAECKTPRLALAPNGKVYLVIYDYFFYDSHDQIAFNEFDPTTNSWSGWVVPAPVNKDTFPGFPAIAVSKDGSCHIVWFNWHEGTGYDELVYCMRDASGNWQTPQVLFSGLIMEEGHNAFFPDVASTDDGTVMVVWATSKETEGKMRYILKKPGEGWGQATLITTSEDQYYPSLTANGKKFYASWLDKRGNDVYSLYERDYITE